MNDNDEQGVNVSEQIHREAMEGLNIPDPNESVNQESPEVEDDTEEVVQTTDNTPLEEESAEDTVETGDSDNEAQIETEEPEEVNPRSAQARIRELASQKNQAREESGTLKDQMDILQRGIEQVGGNPADFLPKVEAGQELTPEQYQQHVAQTAEALIDLKLKQRDNVQRIAREVGDSLQAFPELDNNSESYDDDLSSTITEAVTAYVRSNPTGNVKGYIEKMMKPYKRSIEKGVSNQTEAAVKQASKTALRPAQVKKTEKKFSELSLSEMEQKLGKVY